jgi:hypothetical protein
MTSNVIRVHPLTRLAFEPMSRPHFALLVPMERISLGQRIHFAVSNFS